MEGNGNCLPNLILKQVNFAMDPRSDALYTQTYLRHQVIMHLIANWEVLGQEIKENIKISYGPQILSLVVLNYWSTNHC